ncbi:17b47ef5-ac06-40e1-893e-5801d4d3fa42 [Thermothielavioides terrestris]|uniref:SIR2-like protein n=2 Tax=Thermothielavioides terrestris TaxID=2587410 RepID=G2QRV6_THETT|nr:SIR2-like protein [Thermothielavioides terrestris NRRL 8126]AEO64250.1 SIR2-like protein [Thermothielavioides terrestris NRRL 8126]SPQ26901.1 17b47ef5-ac06-40e1-893e-5801d4d3fa42 [Thermothielavioides terrestris]
MDSSRRAQGKNGSTNGAPATRKPSTRVKNVVDYDEKRHFAELTEEVDAQPEPVPNPGLSELEERVNDLSESWETESLFQDALEDLAEDRFFTDDPEACTPEEATNFRQMLRSVGPTVFCERTIGSGLITAKKLLTAFGIRPPAFLEGADDEAYYSLLSLALSRELSKRAKLVQYNTVDDAVELLKKSNNIIVLTGAGISTSLGIPDFRSKGTGLYSKLEHLGLNDPQEVFDINVFRQDPSIFYSVARDILPSQERFSPTHAFIALLQEKGKLLTNYSQNIDNLEAKAGIKPEKLIQCHGSFATASCVKCGHKVPGETIFPEIKAGKIPRCRRCAQGNRTTANSSGSSANGGRKRKVHRDGTEKRIRRRPGDYDSNSDSEFDHAAPVITGACGVMKPDITFFGEPLPDEFARRLTEHDRDRVDLVVVIGTSLKVAPVSEVVPFLPPHVPQIYVSRTPVSHVNFDIDLLGDCDVVVAELCRRAGWDLRHEMVPDGQVVSITPADGFSSRHVFTQVSPPVVKAEPPPAAASPEGEEEKGGKASEGDGEEGEKQKREGRRGERRRA